jgi:hypothetical protein
MERPLIPAGLPVKGLAFVNCWSMRHLLITLCVAMPISSVDHLSPLFCSFITTISLHFIVDSRCDLAIDTMSIDAHMVPRAGILIRADMQT